MKDNQVYRDYQLQVRRGQKTAEIRVVARAPDAAPVPVTPAQPVPTRPTEKEEGFVDLFNGKDLTGWESDTDASSFSVNEQEQELIAGPIAADSKLRRHWLFTREDYSDYILRLEFFPVDEKVKSAVAIKGKMGSDPLYNIELAIQVRDPVPAQGRRAAARPTGSLIINGVDGVTPTAVPEQKIGDWNDLEIKLQGSVVTVTLNDRLVQEVDMAKIDRAGLSKEAIENIDRRPGRIGLQSMEGTMKYRHIRLRNLSPPPRNDYRRAFGQHTYRFMNESRTWSEALQRCERLSGRLAVVDSPEKNAFLAQLLAENKGQGAWISVTRDGSDKNWVTQNGKPLKYTNWLDGEPREGLPHGLMTIRETNGQRANGKWRSADNEDRAGFFLEWDLPAGQAPPAKADNPTRKAAESIVQMGGHIEIASAGKRLWIRSGSEPLPDSFTLVSVHLANNQQFKDDHLKALSEVHEIESLNLNGTSVTSRGLQHISRLTRLKFVNLCIGSVGDADLAVFKQLPQLNSLEVSFTAITDEGLEHLRDCKSLRTLYVDKTKVTEQGRAKLKESLPQLQIFPVLTSAAADRRAAEYVLSVGGRVLIDDQATEIASLDKLPTKPFQLRVAILEFNKKVTDEGLASFEGCQNLKAIDLDRANVSDAGLVHFRNCRQLKSLNLIATRTNDTALSYFRDCRSLSHVWLINAPVTDAGIANLSECKLLEVFDVAGTKISDAGLAFLKNNKELELLSVSWAGVSDEGLAHVRDCPKLRRLYLVDSKITDTGLRYFQDHPLTVLNASGTAITDEGLTPFLKCKTLQSLIVKRTKISSGLLQKFKTELPACKVEF
jgi:Leucine-rich repeat (LRR) protein